MITSIWGTAVSARVAGALGACALAVGFFGSVDVALAQTDFPSRPIFIVVPFDPGGVPDLVARKIGAAMQASMGQPVVIENRPGAGGSIASRYVAQSKPDGYTLIMGSISTHAINAAVYANLSYNPATDFDAVAQVGWSPFALAVSAALPVNSMAELIQYGKSHTLTYGSSGVGSSNHLAGALFAKLNGLEVIHVPYRGGPPSVLDLIKGEINFLLYAPAGLIASAKDGKIKPLAMASKERSSSMPDVPTLREVGAVDFDVSGFVGLYAPAGTPKPVIEKLHAEVQKVLVTPEYQAWMTQQGLDTAKGVSSEDFSKLTKSEVVRWKGIAETAGVRPQ